MPSPLNALLTLQLELVLHGLTMTKQALEIWLRFQPQPSRVTTPVAALLPAIADLRQDRRPPAA